MKRRIGYPLSGVGIVLADQAVKAASAALPPEGRTLIPGVLGLRRVENTGVAFSMLGGVPWAGAALAVLGLAAGCWLIRRRRLPAFPLAALTLMMGGAAGNLTDRLLRGAVVDMIEPLFISFAVFNLADVCLTVGCALMIVSLLFRPGDWREEDARGDR